MLLGIWILKSRVYFAKVRPDKVAEQTLLMLQSRCRLQRLVVNGALCTENLGRGIVVMDSAEDGNDLS